MKQLLTTLSAAILSASLLMGCASLGVTGQAAANYTLNASVITASIDRVVPLLKQANTDLNGSMDQFSPAQRARLKLSVTTLQNVVAQADSITNGSSNAAQVTITLSQVQNLYASAKGAYMQARPIIVSKFDALPAQTQVDFKNLDVVAKQLDSSMAQVNANPSSANITNVIQSILTISATVATIVNTASPQTGG